MVRDSGGLIPSYVSTSPDRIFFEGLRKSTSSNSPGLFPNRQSNGNNGALFRPSASGIHFS